jgi:hypothetical protein
MNYKSMNGLSHKFTVRKNAYGKTTIKLSYYDKLFVRALSDYLKAILNLTPTKLNVATKSFISLAKNNSFDTFLRLDVKDFQSNVNAFEILDLYIKGSISEFVYKQLNSILTSFNMHGVDGIPRGVALSNVLAEVLLKKVDMHIKTLPIKNYLRYADDILILADNPEEIFHNVSKIFKLYNLKVNESKLFIANKETQLKFLGYSVKRNKALIISVDDFHFKKIKTKLKRRIRKENELKSMINRVNSMISIDSKSSMLRHYKYITDFNQLKALDSHIYRQIRINYFGRNKDIDRKKLPIGELKRLGLKSCVTEVGKFKKRMYNFAMVIKS